MPSPRARNHAAILCWVAVAASVGILATACNSTGKPYTPNVTAKNIVITHAQTSFEAFFDVEADKASLTKFLEETASATCREDLESTWAGIGELQAKGPGFLDKEIFQRAMKDGNWPSEGTVDEKTTFVDGTRGGLEKFLKEG